MRIMYDAIYLICMCTYQSWMQGMGGQGGQLPTQDLADQLTLYQPEGADCTPHIIQL